MGTHISIFKILLTKLTKHWKSKFLFSYPVPVFTMAGRPSLNWEFLGSPEFYAGMWQHGGSSPRSWTRPSACSILCIPFPPSCTTGGFTFPWGDTVAHVTKLCPYCINCCPGPSEDNWKALDAVFGLLRNKLWVPIYVKGGLEEGMWEFCPC